MTKLTTLSFYDEEIHDGVKLGDFSDQGVPSALSFLHDALEAGKQDAFASNKFLTDEALHFVEKLITAGAMEVFIPIRFMEDDGPYSDTLLIRLTDHGLTTTLKRVIYTEGDPDDIESFPSTWEPKWIRLWWD